MSKNDIEPHCSFCGKAKHEVKKLIAGQDANICNECIELCDDLIAESKSLGSDGSIPMSVKTGQRANCQRPKKSAAT